MGLKKLAYILFIFLISVLHTLTLTTWLDKDSGFTEVNEGVNLKNSADSVFASKKSVSVARLEFKQFNK